MTLVTSSTPSSAYWGRWLRLGIIGERFALGGPYTLGNDGAVADGGVEVGPISPIDVVGDSGGG